MSISLRSEPRWAAQCEVCAELWPQIREWRVVVWHILNRFCTLRADEVWTGRK